MLRHLGAFLLAGAFLLPTSGCNCGGDPAAGTPDADTPAGQDASATGFDASKKTPDAGTSVGVDTGVVVGLDTGLTPGVDGSVQPGLDASVVPGADASVQPVYDGAIHPPGDAAQPGPDAALPGPDASQPGLDASVTPGADAGSLGTVVVDLRADVNRNGTVDLADPTEDQGEDTWDSTHGAIFLANIDDDLNACPKSGGDTQLASCNDAADTVLNGADDLLDLARLETVPWPGAPGDAEGALAVTSAAPVRLFVEQGAGTWAVFTPGTSRLGSSQLRAGAKLAIEGKDVVRNSALWDGYVDVTLTVSGSGFSSVSDKVRLRIAPIVARHHLHPPLRVYATPVSGDQDSADFRSDLRAALTASGISTSLFELDEEDQWTQDNFETAYMSMPAAGGPHVIHVNVRSANYSRSGGTGLRAGGRVVFTQLRGPDVGGIQVTPNHDRDMDTLDSFGNLETIPPYSWNGKSYPLGRVYRGSTPTWHPDVRMRTLFESQQVQPAVYVDTSFLLVGHVDETVTFLKAATPRGWTVAVADPTLAKTILEQEEAAGRGSTVVFPGMYVRGWSGWSSAEVTISELLDDTAVMDASATAAAAIDDQLAILKAETGITDAEILHFPVLFEKVSGYGVAHTPGTVNGISLGDTNFGAPDPHGPIVNGNDLFKTQLTAELGKVGITPRWIENWYLYHLNLGEVHCGSNTTRQVPATERWWESGR